MGYLQSEDLVIKVMTTLGCHLCEDAKAMLQYYKEESGFLFTVDPIEIAESEVLMNQYEVRIPVLLHSISKQELAWPFDMQQLAEFLHSKSVES